MANGKTISKGGKLLFLVSNKLVVEAPVAQWDLIIFNGIKKFFIICPILFFFAKAIKCLRTGMCHFKFSHQW